VQLLKKEQVVSLFEEAVFSRFTIKSGNLKKAHGCEEDYLLLILNECEKQSPPPKSGRRPGITTIPEPM
jgi:hypothetical protein